MKRWNGGKAIFKEVLVDKFQDSIKDAGIIRSQIMLKLDNTHTQTTTEKAWC